MTHGPFVEGTQETLRILVELDGVAVDLDQYGAITPVLTSGAGTVYGDPGTCAKVSPQTGDNKGWAVYTPPSTGWPRSEGLLPRVPEKLGLRLLIEDAEDTPLPFPNGAADTVLVYAR